MNERELIKNFKHVKREASEMLDSIAQVKGKRHGEYVHTLLLVRQLSEVVNIIATGKVPQHLMPKIMEQYGEAVSSILSMYHEASGMPDCEVDGLLKEADTIFENTNRLAVSAIHAAREGQAFGDN